MILYVYASVLSFVILILPLGTEYEYSTPNASAKAIQSRVYAWRSVVRGHVVNASNPQPLSSSTNR